MIDALVAQIVVIEPLTNLVKIIHWDEDVLYFREESRS